MALFFLVTRMFPHVAVSAGWAKSPTMGRRATSEAIVNASVTSDEPNGESTTEPRATPTSAQRLASSAASVTEVAPDPYGREAKHFTETRVLNRDVRIVLEGVDKYSHLIGSVYYPDGESAKGPGIGAIEMCTLCLFMLGFSKKLETVLTIDGPFSLIVSSPATNSKAIHDQNFTGKVVEVVSGDCLVIADDSLPFGDPSAERRVNLSSACFNGVLSKVSMADGPAPPTSGADSRQNHVLLLGRRGIHSPKEPPVMHVTDLLTASSKKARDFLPFLQRNGGLRCPGRDEPYSEEAIALMRRKIMQRDIEVETVDRTGTFIGTLWESRSNVAVTLLEAGLAKASNFFGTDRTSEVHLLMQAEQAAKKIWENYVEGEEVATGGAAERRQKEEVKEASVIGAFNPKKGDIVLAQFSADNSWNRAMPVASLMHLCPSPGLAQLCSLAHVKVPGLDDDYGQEAAYRLSELLLSGPKEFRAVIEEKDTSGGKVKGQGTGTIFWYLG
ncbi:hypothetical protein HAX54_037417 [Datura stramonium]|uniref:TNase-like domain-containing protein n=1 Tax=Datura stramonium TaxID=4076 RepID=A0ABS8SH18_DATST|nr:hypothetical protein [Datura stramonium]